MKYDVIVVGAGPAGSTTAKYAAENGAKTLLIDRRKEIGVPLQCGEFLPDKKEIKDIFPKADGLSELFDIDEDLISKKTDTINMISPKGKEYKIHFKGFSLDRPKFDKRLAYDAVDAGAELKLHVVATGLKNGMVLTNKGIFKGKIIVGADGPFSRIAKWSGLSTPSNLSPCILCLVKGDFSSEIKMYFGGVAPGGYAWIIPKSDGANIGLGVQKNLNKVSLKKLLSKFLEGYVHDYEEILFMSGGYVPVSGTIPKTVKDNILIVGDAAGHVMATNGGGIPIAMICGRICGKIIGEHINNKVPLEQYETEWRRCVGKPLKIASDTKKLADFFFKHNIIESPMRLMGIRGMERAIRCKGLGVWG
ncbi:MAG TPA: NAD(P)/FAD-dependent oxidoreductase [Methanosarcinales archaeon]|nr:NAD(P)/FAD-dependent oxidoreductase [Methanosarcinales archaeon]